MTERERLGATIRANRTKLAFLNNESEDRLGAYRTPTDITIARLEAEIEACKKQLLFMSKREAAIREVTQNRENAKTKAKGAP